MVNKGILIVGGIAVIAVAAYLFFKGGNQAPGGGGLLGGGGVGQANPTSVQAPQSVTPSSLFTSTPSLSTGGSGSGNFTLAQTYSPYYSTSNTYSNQTTTTTISQPQVTVKTGIWT